MASSTPLRPIPRPVPGHLLAKVSVAAHRYPGTVARGFRDPSKVSENTLGAMNEALATLGYAPLSPPSPASGTPDGAEGHHEPQGAEPGRL